VLEAALIAFFTAVATKTVDYLFKQLEKKKKKKKPISKDPNV
jgi:hypothetical protein